MKTDHLFRNAGILEASDLDLSANIFDQVSLRGKDTSQLKAQNISVVATENLNLKAGSLEADHIALTSLGTFANKSDVKSSRIQITTHGEGVQDGVFQADVIDVASHAAWRQRGTLTASQEAKFWMGEGQVFEQQGVIQTPKVTLAGEKSLFRNTRPLALQELRVEDPLQFENASPLTAEEAQGKEEPATQVTIGKFVGPVESSLTNTGFLTIHEGMLGTVQNRGVWTSEQTTISTLQQGGRMKVSQLTIQNNGVNKGEMFLHELNGKGSFQQSGLL